MTKNVYRFRKLKWGDPDKPWLKRGSPLPPADDWPPDAGTPAAPRAGQSPFDSPWMILGGFALAFGLGILLFSSS